MKSTDIIVVREHVTYTEELSIILLFIIIASGRNIHIVTARRRISEIGLSEMTGLALFGQA